MRFETDNGALVSAYAGHSATPSAAVAAEPAMKSRRRMRPLFKGTRPQALASYRSSALSVGLPCASLSRATDGRGRDEDCSPPPA